MHIRCVRTTRAGRRIPVKSGFTLIELLVVIGVIAVLVAILLPALRSARRSATRIACGSQLRQFGIAMQMYVNDFRGWLPSASRAQGDLGSDYVNVQSYLNPKTNEPINFSFPELWNQRYLSSQKIALCPAFDRGIADQYANWYGWTNQSGYITNGGRMGYLYLNLSLPEFMYYINYSSSEIYGQYSLRLNSRWSYAGKLYTTQSIALMQDTVAYPYTETPPGGFVPPFTAHGTNVAQEGGNIMKGDWSVKWVPFGPNRYAFLPSGYYNYIDLSD